MTTADTPQQNDPPEGVTQLADLVAQPPAEGFDLSEVLVNLGTTSPARALVSDPPNRKKTSSTVELLEKSVPHGVDMDNPLRTAGFVDGIQAAMCLTYWAHRPLYMVYIASAGMTLERELVGLGEDIRVYHSVVDTEAIAERNLQVPTTEIRTPVPPDIEREALKLMSAQRAKLERAVVEDLAAKSDHPVVLDGDLAARSEAGAAQTASMVGVAKTVQTQYLEDEAVLYKIRAGERSPLFAIERPGRLTRYSCYVRLHDASRKGWAFGLVRLEAYDQSQLSPLAALAMQTRQPPGGKDTRWDRHLWPVREVEEQLRARRPRVFSL